MAALVASAGPASAHTLTGVPPTNYRSEVLAVDPPAPGVHVELLDLGRRIRLTNSGPDEVVVLGYQREPYLRVGPQGVFENRHSPAVYQNRVTAGAPTGTTLPPQADAAAPPEWHRTSTGHTATWRDQRTRWEGADPPEVARAPRLTQIVVPTWTIELRKGDTPVLIEGRITWVPGPSPWPWVALALGLAAGCSALVRWRHWGPALSGCVATLVALDIVRSVGVAMAGGGSVAAMAVSVLIGGLVSVIAWVVGVRSIGALQHGRESGSLAAGGAGFFIAVYTLSDLPVLSRSQVPQAFSSSFARAAVAGSLGLGVGLVVAAGLIERRAHSTGRSRGRAMAGAGMKNRSATSSPAVAARRRTSPKAHRNGG
jgi:hypothetical protein